MADTDKKPDVKRNKLGGVLITKENAAQYCYNAAQAKHKRAELRRKLLKAAVDEGLDKIFVKALKSGDPEQLELVAKASKLVGVDFASSEEAVQRVDAKVDAKSNNKVEVVVSGIDG